MPVPAAAADQIARRIREAADACQSSLRVVMAHQTLGESTVYGRLVGNFMGYAFTNILQPLWKAYPELEPDSMNGPYVEPVAERAPEVKESLATFLEVAKSALAFARDQLPPNDDPGVLQFGGLAEVEDAAAEIESFLRRPRFRDELPK